MVARAAGTEDRSGEENPLKGAADAWVRDDHL